MTPAPASRLRLSFQLTVLLLWLLVGAVSLPGCGGCQKETAAQKKKRIETEKKKEEERKRKKKAEQPKPNFEPIISQVLPNTVTTNPTKNKEKEKEKDETKNPTLDNAYVKPGHFVSVMQTLKANNFDYPGILRTYPHDVNGNPLDVFRTNYRVSMFRPASLPKGQAKFIESTYFLPQREILAGQSRYLMRVELLSSRGGSVATSDSAIGTAMRDHEYFIVVLAANADPYVGLKDPKIRSVVVTQSEIDQSDGSLRYYHVVLPKIERRVPLPSASFAWTTIAYIIWDDLDPAILTQDQQHAMLDWIHWGGQLIISGPNSLDKLKGTFLAPYLPAESGQALKLNQASFAELNQNWSLESKGNDKAKAMTAEERSIKFVGDKPMLGVELKKHPLGDFLKGTGDLVVERRVGGGRIAATAFPLTDIRIRLWPGFDCFLNGCLLRRPPREFLRTDLVELRMNWATPELRNYVRDPRIACTLRYFSRDIGFPQGQERPAGVSRISPINDAQRGSLPRGFPYVQDAPEPPAEVTIDKQPVVDDWHFAGYRADNESGVGGWSDLTPVSQAARESLSEAGKIAIPKADFVLRVLAIYLLVLVPLNWLFFWLIGRVEWAWAAAPIIAIIGAICVIRLAQLNIGFVRSRTEIAVLETQADYPRGHVTRYTRLYTSLSTGYDVSFEDPSAVSLPFVSDINYKRLPNENAKYVEYRQDKNTVLSGVQVNSNSTEGVHSEHMVPLEKAPTKPGGITLTGNEQTGLSVLNDTQFTLHDIGVLRRVDGQIQVAYLAEIQPGTAAPLRFVPSNEAWVSNWDQSLIMSAKVQAKEEDKGVVRLYRLVELAARQLKLVPGDVRLIAWTDDAVPGMKIYPSPAQSNTRTLVLSHLARAKIPAPQRDVNVAEDFVLPELDEEKPDGDAPADANTQLNNLRPALAAQR